jgi:thymidylate synthase
MQKYKHLVKYVLDKGTLKSNRTGIDTVSLFNFNYKIDLTNGFPLLTTKKMRWNNIVVENLWFLSGSNSPEFLHKHRVHFWDAWIQEQQVIKYCECANCKHKSFHAKPEKMLPEAYGRFWRQYPRNVSDFEISDRIIEPHFDQFATLIKDIKKNPFSRRHVLTNWYPPSAMFDPLPPCHLMAIFNVQQVGADKILNLHLTQRSCDIAIGLPYNIAGYAFLLHLVGHLTGLKVGEFAHSIVDAHIYENHEGGLNVQLGREPRELPEIWICPELKTIDDLDELIQDGTTEDISNCFQMRNYNPHPFIKFEVAV